MEPLFSFVAVGPWKFDPRRLVITHAAMPAYEVDVESMKTSAGMLDWIFHVRKKPWVKPVDMEPFVRLLDIVIDPQATLCSFGTEQGPIDVRSVAAEKVG